MMNVFLGIMAVLLWIGMVGDEEAQNRLNFTNGFVVVILAIIVINVVNLILHFIG